MNLFNVYPLYEIEPVRGYGAFIYDKNNTPYLDFYGGHAVISVGHSHPHYVERITKQLNRIGFYSNSVLNNLQQELADKLAECSGLDGYDLFLCNSGAEANENALKMASFLRPKTNKVITLKNAFHGRTSAAVNVTDNEKIKAPINRSIETLCFETSQGEELLAQIAQNDTTAVILEMIQGIGGLSVFPTDLLEAIDKACKANGTVLIMDEVQCGYGRSGKFFAYQHSNIQPDIITIAKGMGNGFPIAGVLLNSQVFEAKYGLLGTTFGGNHLACAAGIAVLEIMKEEQLIAGIAEKSAQLKNILSQIPQVKEVKGMGLMLGAKFDFEVKDFRKHLLFEEHLFTGSAKDPNMLRLLPPLNITVEEISLFGEKLQSGLNHFLQ